MKFFHNKFVGRLLSVILGVACAIYFGWTFSYFGFWMGEKFQGALPEAPSLVALACGLIMFLFVIFAFFYYEYTKEDVQGYEDDKGDGSFIGALHQLKWAVLGLELFSLLFRLFQLNFAPVGIAMVGIGVVLLWLSHLFGKILHAQANAPTDIEMDRISEEAKNRAAAIARAEMHNIDDLESLRRIGDGDFSPIDGVKEARDHEITEQQTNAEKRRKDAQAQREKARASTRRWLTPRKPEDPADFIEQPSQNGHSKRPVNFQ